MGAVYLIHFRTPFKHAKHYIGYASNVSKRISKHRSGCGAKLLMHAQNAGIEWDVVRIWWGVDRAFERKLKNRGGAARSCPCCNEKLKKHKIKSNKYGT